MKKYKERDQEKAINIYIKKISKDVRKRKQDISED